MLRHLAPPAVPPAGCIREVTPLQADGFSLASTFDEAPFWSNVERFARFFISSVAGLILQLLSPFAMFSRSPALAAVGGTLFIGILAFIYITLTAMQAPLDVAVATEAARDPSMQSMLNDIYGP